MDLKCAEKLASQKQPDGSIICGVFESEKYYEFTYCGELYYPMYCPSVLVRKSDGETGICSLAYCFFDDYDENNFKQIYDCNHHIRELTEVERNSLMDAIFGDDVDIDKYRELKEKIKKSREK